MSKNIKVQLWPPFRRQNTTITQRTSGDTINSTGNLTFVTGKYIASGSTNGNTLTLNANDTAFITFTTGATDTCALASAVTATTQAAGNNSTLIATTAYVDAAVGTVNSFAEILALSNITGANDIVVSTTQSISTALVDDNYFLIKAVDNDPNTASEVARAQGAADPYFSAGGTQQFKFYNSGIASFAGAATGDAFIDISPTLTGNAATNTYAVNISPVGITIPTGTTAIAASLYVAEPIFTETGVLTLASNVYIDAAPTEGGTNYSLYVVGTSYLNGAITAPGGLTGNITGDCSGSSGTCTGNAATVTNATFTTALTVNTGTLTLTANAANNSVLTIGAGAVSVSGANTGDNTVATALTGTPSITVNTVTTTGNIELGAATDCTIARTGAGAISVEGVAVLLSGGALGTPSSGTVTNLTGTMTNLTLVTPALGTPASGVLTSCTGLPAAAVVAGSFGTGAYVMDSSLQVSTIELGHATANTLSASGGVLSIEGVVIPSISSTNTLTNKRITQRVVTTTDDATAVIDIDVTDVYELSAIANATEFTLTGTPTSGQKLIVKLKDAGVAKGLTWTGFTAIGVTLPTTTVAGKQHYIGCFYNGAATRWEVIAVTTEA